MVCISIEKIEFERLREKKLELYQKISEDNDRIDAQTKKVSSVKMSNTMQMLIQFTAVHSRASYEKMVCPNIVMAFA